jgi:hypothetical protein
MVNMNSNNLTQNHILINKCVLSGFYAYVKINYCKMCFCVLFCFHGNQVTLKIAITVYGDASYLDLSFKLLFGKILEEMVILVRN